MTSALPAQLLLTTSTPRVGWPAAAAWADGTSPTATAAAASSRERMVDLLALGFIGVGLTRSRASPRHAASARGGPVAARHSGWRQAAGVAEQRTGLRPTEVAVPSGQPARLTG